MKNHTNHVKEISGKRRLRSGPGLSEKFHLSLTEYAFDVLEEDRRRFATVENPVSRDELYSTIIRNCYLSRTVPAFLSKEYTRMKQEWKKQAGKETMDMDQMEEAFVRACRELYLIKYSGAKVKLTINVYSDVLDQADELENRVEMKVFTTRIRYFTQILEAFARMVYGEREGIFFREWIEVLQKAQGKIPLIIESLYGPKGTFIPYEIGRDQLGLFWYVGGMMMESESANRKTPYSCSWRISRLLSIRPDPRYEEGLGFREQASLERMISEQKIQYLLADRTQEIRFRLTERGLQLLNTILVGRPNGIKKVPDTENEYVCRATSLQAEVYFSRFGTEMEIISSNELGG